MPDHAGPPAHDPHDAWRDVGIRAYFLAFIVAALTFGGTDVVANALTPDARVGGVLFGSILLGLAAGAATVGVILTIRRALLPEPPSPERPAGKVEL